MKYFIFIPSLLTSAVDPFLKKRVFKQNLFTVAPFAPWYLLNSYQVYALISDLEHDSQTIKET